MLRRRIKASLHNLESASYATEDASKLDHLLKRLEELNQSFRSSLPSEKGLSLRPSVLVSRAKVIKQRALKRLQKAATLASLVNTNRGKPGRKREHWKTRNRVGQKVDKLRKVSSCTYMYTCTQHEPFHVKSHCTSSYYPSRPQEEHKVKARLEQCQTPTNGGLTNSAQLQENVPPNNVQPTTSGK